MQNISIYSNCYRCAICVLVCKKAITIHLNNDGFYALIVDSTKYVESQAYLDLCTFNDIKTKKREAFFKFTKKKLFNHINRLLKVSLIQRIKWRLYAYISKLRGLLTR